MNQSCLKHYSESNELVDTLFVSFAGYNKLFGAMARFEFANFLKINFAKTDRYYYVDQKFDLYHKGIHGISKNIDETVAYLKNEIAKYSKVIFIGVSAGGYAAILFGSLLNISAVVAFIPQTLRTKSNINEKYRDICPYINNVTQYYIYGDISIQNPSDCHHISHCERIVENRTNVFLIKKDNFNIKKMRDDGELFTIFNDIIQKKGS
jgi:hypothetical protein